MDLKNIAAVSLLVAGLLGANAAEAHRASDSRTLSLASMTCSQLAGLSADGQAEAGAGSYVAACQAASASSTLQDAVSHNTNSTPTNNGGK